MAIRIREITVLDGCKSPTVLCAVPAADPETPCVGCSLRYTYDCFDCCENFVEDGYHFEPAVKNDPVSTQLQAIESAYGSAGCAGRY